MDLIGLKLTFFFEHRNVILEFSMMMCRETYVKFVLNLIFLQRDSDTITKLIEGSIPSSAIQENGLPEWIATA